jgi:TonB-dependent starch-binding outer membrane protein SusC
MKKSHNYYYGLPKPYSNWHKFLLTMKITAFLLFFGLAGSIAGPTYSQNTKISLDMKGSTIERVLNKIEDASEFYFLYNQKLIDVDRKVDIVANDEPIKDILREIFDNTVRIVVSDRQIVLTPNESSTELDSLLQQLTISGKITDSSNGEAMPGVNISVKGTNIGTTSGVNGFYNLSVPDRSAVLVVSFIGYVSQEIPVGNKATIDVSLMVETKGLDEVVVIGYGVQKKSVVTGAISSIKAEDLKNSSVVRAEQALAGKTSGVQVIQTSGAPGADLNVRIRGYGSNKSSEPIYIVDGTKVFSISSIDPNDIKNIEILKDAASSAIYGAEGANGVVLVTTRGGAGSQGGHLTYEFQHSIQTMAHKVNVLDANEYYNYFTEAGSLATNVDRTYNTDWQNAIFKATPSDKHYVSFTDGNDRGSFLLSLSYLNQDGIVVGDKDKYQRYTFMFNSDYKIKKWLKVGHNLTITHTDLKAVSENSEYGSVVSGALMMDPLTPVTYTGKLPVEVQSLLDLQKTLLKDEKGNYYGISSNINGEVGNPFIARDRTQSINQNNNIFGNIFADFTPLKGLTLTTRMGMTLGFSDYHLYNPIYYYNASQTNNASSVTETTNLMTFWQWDNYATYNRTIGKHSATILVGFSPNELTIKNLSGNAGPLLVDNTQFDDLSYTVANPSDNVTGYRSLTRKLSYFGRVNYEYANKYLLQFSLRRDAAGMDILSKTNRWGTFPAVSAGWVISNESFFPKSFVSFLKVRGSWGQNGSLSNLGSYPYASLLASASGTTPTAYPVSEAKLATATFPTTLSNINLGWETSEQTDIGLEARTFNDKLTMTIDYYNKITKGLITTGTPPLIAGNAATSINAGNVQNRGIELELSFRHKIGDLSYSINANVATLHNEVTYMNPNNPRLSGAVVNLFTATMFEKGYPIWYFFGYKTYGVNPKNGDMIYYNAKGDTTSSVKSSDQQYIGSGIPKMTFGVTLNMAYKGFDFRAFMQGQTGNKVMVGMIRTDRLNYNILEVFYNNRWTTSNTDGTMPRANNGEANKWHSDLMLFDGSFMKVKQLQLGYNLPKSILSKIAASNARLYVSLENAFTFTKYPGMDPEVGSSTVNSIGIDRGMYPICRTILLGASITF